MKKLFQTLTRAVALSASAMVLLGTPVAAQTFPSKPIRIVVPFGAGGVADLTARTVAQKMSESLGQSVIIDNKPGAGGVVAGEAVAKAEPDGHTLLLMSNGTAVSAGLFKALPFDAVRDFAPVSTLGYFDIAILTAADAPYKSMAELLAYAKANPGKLNVGTINIGSTQNLAAELFRTRTGLDFLVVPFNGTPAVTTALRGHQVDIAIEILGPMMGQVQSKAVRVLAVMGDTRAEQLPDVPTLMQSGVRDFDVSSWNALAAPAKTPKEVIARLNREVQAAVNSPDVKKKLFELNVQAKGSTPEQLGSLLQSDIKRWTDVINKAGVPKM
jgi:tripartite-type tricarboxylate transporter receptor subunit TctC